MPTVLITHPGMQKEGLCVDLFREADFEVRYPRTESLWHGRCSQQETIDELSGAQATIACGEKYTDRVLESLPELRVISRWGVGFDSVDVAAATRRGIIVTVTPGSVPEAVSEHCLALILATAKSVIANDRRVREDRWEQRTSQPIRGKTLGILGLGRIGRGLALRALGFRMKVIATEINPDEAFLGEHGVELVDWATLLARSDYLSLNCALTEETRGIIDKHALSKMKPGSVLINTGRGGLVVETDLVEALSSGPLRGAGLDVFQREPIDPDHPLLKLENVIVSPHSAGVDELSFIEASTEATQNIIRLNQGQWPDGAVLNSELKTSWKW